MAGADAASAVELHGEGEQPHAGEIVTLKLNAQADGTFAGLLLFASKEEQGYAFTSAAGDIATDAAGSLLETRQNLTIDCEDMTVGRVTLYGLDLSADETQAGALLAFSKRGEWLRKARCLSACILTSANGE